MRRNTKSNRKATRRSKTRNSLAGGSSLIPPPYVPTIKFAHKFRFASGANAGNFNITRANILNLIAIATTPTSAVRLFEALRLKKVEMWTNPSALGAAPVNLELEWLGENAPSTVISDVSMGVRPAHIRAIPPPSSSNRWWSISGFSETDILFSLGVAANTVIDVTLEVRVVDSESPTLISVLPVGATVGQLYGNYLDGIGSGKLAMLDYIPIP